MCPDDVFYRCEEVTGKNDKIDIHFSKLDTKSKKVYPVQTRFGSVVETMLNVSSGIITANAVWHFAIIKLYPALDTESAGNVFIVNLIFTAVSIVRGLCWRRLFVWLRIKELWKHA